MTTSMTWSVLVLLIPFFRFLLYFQIGAVLQNFSDSVTAALNLDIKLAAAGASISGNYSDLLAISTRQAFGAFDLTVSLSGPNNTVNASDVKAFSRNFGNLGSGGCVLDPCRHVYVNLICH